VARMSASERRELLVEAAIRVMTRDGVVRATTRAIAGEAGMPLGVFHYAFRSKAELMAVVTETIAQQSKAEIDAATLSGTMDDPYELVVGGLCAYFEHVVAHPHEHLVTYELTTTALRDPELGAGLHDPAHAPRTPGMPGDPAQAPGFGPAAVPVHDDPDVKGRDTFLLHRRSPALAGAYPV